MAPQESIMAFVLVITSPRYHHSTDAIIGSHSRVMDELGTFETSGWACKKADLLYNEYRLDLGDGDDIHVRNAADPFNRDPMETATTFVSSDDDCDIPF
jgi:hypothetical protein